VLRCVVLAAPMRKGRRDAMREGTVAQAMARAWFVGTLSAIQVAATALDS